MVNVRSASEHPLTAFSHKISSNTDKILRILFGIMKVKDLSDIRYDDYPTTIVEFIYLFSSSYSSVYS